MNLLNARGATLLDNVRGKIDLVMRRANARTQLHNQIRRRGTEAFSHLLNSLRGNRQRGSLFPRMNQPDRRRFWIDNVNRAAIGDVNAERDLLLISDQTVAAGEFVVLIDWFVDHRDFVSMNLLSSQQRPIFHSNLVAILAMNRL